MPGPATHQVTGSSFQSNARFQLTIRYRVPATNRVPGPSYQSGASSNYQSGARGPSYPSGDRFQEPVITICTQMKLSLQLSVSTNQFSWTIVETGSESNFLRKYPSKGTNISTYRVNKHAHLDAHKEYKKRPESYLKYPFLTRTPKENIKNTYWIAAPKNRFLASFWEDTPSPIFDLFMYSLDTVKNVVTYICFADLYLMIELKNISF